MGRLFLLLFKYRAMFVFVLLEVFCVWMIVSTDIFISASAFNSSNRVVASTIQFSNSVHNYIGLQTVNNELVAENAKLKQELTSIKQSIYDINIIRIEDEAVISQYEYLDAKVINNTTEWLNNFITINKGSSSGIEPGMGVVNQYGVVGKVQSVSEHYSVLASVLHNNVMVSSKMKRIGTIGTINWGGKNPQLAKLDYIPRHIEPVLGDTIVTSGYNAVFPENILIGVIEDFDLKDDQNFYDITVRLQNDYTKLSFLYIIKNKLKAEKDSIEVVNQIAPNE